MGGGGGEGAGGVVAPPPTGGGAPHIVVHVATEPTRYDDPKSGRPLFITKTGNMNALLGLDQWC